MKLIYITIFLGVLAVNAGAVLNGAWFNAGVAPYASPYAAYSTISAEVEAVLENGDTFHGFVLIYDQGIYVVYEDNRRDFIEIEPGLTIEKKGRSEVRFELPGGDVIIGEAASRVNGQRLFLREDTPCPRRSFVLIFSDKYNYEPNLEKIKSLKIENITEAEALYSFDEGESLFK
jgi:hypothetical protein